MSDLPATALSGGVSPSRDIATHRYRVTAELGLPDFPVGSEFRAWAWGETFAQVEGRGPVLTNGQIEEWLKAAKIERLTADPVQRSPVDRQPADTPLAAAAQ